MLDKNDLSRSFQEIDDDILERSEGIAKKSRKNDWIKWAIMAICVGIVMIIGIIAALTEEKEKEVYVDENSTYGMICKLEERYDKTAVTVGKEYDFSDEYISLYERCIIVEFNDKKYYTQSSFDSAERFFVAKIDESLLGEVIGTCKAKCDYNTYLDEILSVRKICGVSSDLIIAIEMEGCNYVFCNKLYGVETLGELLEFYSLPQVLELNRFELDDEYYTLDEEDAVWEMLSAYPEAEFVWGSLEGGSEMICFTVKSESLGIYKEEFSVSADGYVSTTIFTHNGAFFIGEEAAREIISYVKENSQRAGYEPYRYSLAGSLSEIGEDYILMKDSNLCKKWSDGMTFRIETDNVLFRRYFECGFIEIGDVFVIEFSGEFDLETGNIELGPAFSITAAKAVPRESDGWLDTIKNIYSEYKRKKWVNNEYKKYIQYIQWKMGLAD